MARHYSEWSHRTAENSRTHGNPVGIDLFDDTNNHGEPTTAIYVRFADGFRWPALTTQSQEVINAWETKYPGPVFDYRIPPDRKAEPNLPHWLDSVMGDNEHAFFYVCDKHANQYGLETDDSCVDGCLCHVKGCQEETSMVHYLWDFRQEVIDHRRRLHHRLPRSATMTPSDEA